MMIKKTLVELDKNSRENAKWLNPAIQCLILINALVVNFLVPIFYGVEIYGKFIQTNILVFVIHKFTDIVLEPLIAKIEPKYLFVTALITSFVVILIAQGINYFDPIGSSGLLVAMLLSSNCMLAMFALKLHRQLLLHLILIQGVFYTLFTCDYYGLLSFTLLELLIWTNLAPTLISILGLSIHGARIPPIEKMGMAIATSLGQFPSNVSTTLVFNCLTNIFPYVFAKQMSALDVGMFRIITSILQSATSLFPINTKTIFVMFIESSKRSRHLQTLMIASLLYFSMIGVCTALLASYVPKLSLYLDMITALPLIFWVALLERYMQATGIRIPLIQTNLTVGLVAVIAAFFVKDLAQAKYLYAMSLAVYACALLASSQITFDRVNNYIIIVCSVLVLLIEPIVPGITIIYMCLLICTIITFTKGRFLEVISLKL
jgi:hypothetical protein